MAPENELTTIESISTEALNLSDVHESVNQEIKLVVPTSEGFQIRPEVVSMSLDVTEFTQKTVTVPIEVINLPEDTTVKIIPEFIAISFDVAMERFNDISASDFKISCDFLERNVEDNFMVVSLEEQPEFVLNVELGEKRVDYLIFK